MSRKISFFGGGNGGWSFLRAMRNSPYDVTVHVACADNGSSNGRIVESYRGQFPPPGDITTLLGAISRLEGDDYREQQQILQYRYPEDFQERSLRDLMRKSIEGNRLDGNEILEKAREYIPLDYEVRIPELRGHRFGNLALIGAMERYGVLEGISKLVKFVDGYATLIPSSQCAGILCWKYVDGTTDSGERKLDGKISIPIKDSWLDVYGEEGNGNISVFEEGLKAIRDSDVLVVLPGSIIGSSKASIPPKYRQAISESKAPLIYMLNAVGEINQAAWPLSDGVQIGVNVVGHCNLISEFCGRPVEYVWAHNWDNYPIDGVMRNYVRQGSLPLRATSTDQDILRYYHPDVPVRIVFGNLLRRKYDPKAEGMVIRHSSDTRRIPEEFEKLLRILG